MNQYLAPDMAIGYFMISASLSLLYIVYLLKVELPNLIHKYLHAHLIGVFTGQKELLEAVKKENPDA